tara:strand:- start:263 stop:574 length:312 start_codon:yes stop_codon:yes gene_type:complete
MRPAAINYKKDKKTYYRKRCEICNKHGINHGIARWEQRGYQKKDCCEKCGFKSKYPEQFNVFHIDGNLDNCRLNNLKTICANCQRVLQKEGVKWKQGDLVPDF